MTFLGYIRKHAKDQDAETIRAAHKVLQEASRFFAAEAAFDFNVGDRVSFRGRHGVELFGKITKTNRTTVTVLTEGDYDRYQGTGMTWRVTATIIKLAPKTKITKAKRKRAA
jgi:hypothetical protein